MTRIRAIFTRDFWLDATERAIRAAAEGVLTGTVLSNAGPVNAFGLDIKLAAGFAIGGAAISLLTSIVSAPVGEPGTASITTTKES